MRMSLSADPWRGASDCVAQLGSTSFDHIPAAMKARVYGVEYAYLDLDTDGELYVTSQGWPWLEYLLPERWYQDQRFVREGQRQPDGYGTVYRVPVVEDGGKPFDLIVKFSRFAQSTMLYAGSDFPECISLRTLSNVRVNCPLEEFGLLMELRRSRIRGCRPVLTKRPLAIYTPPVSYPIERLGRTASRFARCQRALEQDQAATAASFVVSLNSTRPYILIYQWVDGENALAMHRQGHLSLRDMQRLTERVEHELAAHGFRVLDNKPEHIILRKRPEGGLLRRDGQLVYALVDFELLKRLKPDD